MQFLFPTIVAIKIWCDTWYLLSYLSRYLDQETAKWPFWSSMSQAATFYNQSNYSKGRSNFVKCLAQDTTSELGRLSSHWFLYCWTSSRKAV